jgi:hypothetical protein
MNGDGPEGIFQMDFGDMGGGFPGAGMGGFSNVGRPQPRKKPQGPLAKGTKVSIYGLSKTKEHNNKTGTITGYNNETKRFVLTLNDDSMISLQGKKT